MLITSVLTFPITRSFIHITPSHIAESGAREVFSAKSPCVFLIRKSAKLRQIHLCEVAFWCYEYFLVYLCMRSYTKIFYPANTQHFMIVTAIEN